jgi:hypothetical protein
MGNVSADIGGVKTDIGNVSAELSSVKADITSVKADISARISQLQDANTKFQENLRAEAKAENEKLIKRIEQQGQQIRKETTANLDAEARRLTNLVGRVQKETEAELVAVKEQIQIVTTGFESTVEQNTTHTKAVVEELANQLVDHRAEVNNTLHEVNDRFSRQKETIEQVNAKIVALETKISAAPVTAELRATPSPSVVNQNQDNTSVRVDGAADSLATTDGNHPGSCQPANSGTEIVRMSDNSVGMNAIPENASVSSFLSHSELTLPLFDDNSDTNPVFHLRRLDEFMKLKSVPKAFQLAVAYRSIIGQMSKQWVKTVSRNLPDYDAFKKSFLSTWWSASRQSLDKCSLYHGKYNRDSQLSLSGHFLKYATMASYLEPRPTDVEVIEAIRYHFPWGMQRAMLSNQLHTIESTLDVLRRVEVMEASESYQKPHYQPQTSQHQSSRQPNSPRNDRMPNQNQNQVRQIQQFQPRNRNCNRRNRQRREEEREPRNVGSGPLNPNAPAYQGNSGQGQSGNPNHSRSEN